MHIDLPSAARRKLFGKTTIYLVLCTIRLYGGAALLSLSLSPTLSLSVYEMPTKPKNVFSDYYILLQCVRHHFTNRRVFCNSNSPTNRLESKLRSTMRTISDNGSVARFTRWKWYVECRKCRGQKRVDSRHLPLTPKTEPIVEPTVEPEHMLSMVMRQTANTK